MKEEEVEETTTLLWRQNQETGMVKLLSSGQDMPTIINQSFSKEKEYKPTRIVCCDGRPRHDGDDFCVAGSGKLMTTTDFKKMLSENPSIKVITWHDECGAMALAFKQAQTEGNLPRGVRSAAEYAEYWTEQMARDFGLRCEHIWKDDFVAPDHFEQGIIMDVTGKFHPTMLKDMPNMFISHSASFANKEYIVDEAKILTKIALGEHGLGELITAKNPFYVLIACADQDEVEAMRGLLQPGLSEFGDKVQVRAFIVPN